MKLTGKIEDGKVILDTPTALPNGTRVVVEDAASHLPSDRPEDLKDLSDALLKLAGTVQTPTQTVWDGLRELAGTIHDLPPDFALEHDHYIHGTPKRANRS